MVVAGQALRCKVLPNLPKEVGIEGRLYYKTS